MKKIYQPADRRENCDRSVTFHMTARASKLLAPCVDGGAVNSMVAAEFPSFKTGFDLTKDNGEMSNRKRFHDGALTLLIKPSLASPHMNLR